MKIFKPFGGVILGFDDIKSFVLFTLGRICGIFVFLLIIEAFLYFLYVKGYCEEFYSIFELIKLFLKLFI